MLKSALVLAAKALAQDGGPGDTATGVQLLLTDPDDYETAAGQALRVFAQDVPNVRVKDVTVAATAFRFPLSGVGAVLPTDPADLDAWVEGGSGLRSVWWPYSDTAQGIEPMDPNTWRTALQPGSITALEFMASRPSAGTVIRMEYTAPHVLAATVSDESSIRPGDEGALTVLTASVVLQMAATKAVQNTGNTGLPSDIVDRRTQSDQYRSRSRELLDRYKSMVGKGSSGEVGAASGFRELDVEPSSGRGSLWHPSWNR